MAKKLKKTERFNILQIYRLLARHKTALLVSALVVLLVGGVVAYRSSQNSHKFSREDFDYLTTKAEGVLKQVSGEDITVKRTCSYERPGEFDSLHLYCRVAMVVYLPYVSDDNVVGIAQSLEEKVSSLGKILHLSSASKFYSNPSNNRLSTYVNVTNLPTVTQCMFETATQRQANTLGIGLPDNNNDNLLALGFYCAAESRGEYFPVTYRQG